MSASIPELDLDEVDGILAELNSVLPEAKWAKLKQLRERYGRVVQILKDKKSVIRKLKRLIFGPSSEKTRQLLKQLESPESKEEDSPTQPHQKPKPSDGGGDGTKSEANQSTTTTTTTTNNNNNNNNNNNRRKGGKPKGSGRLSASDYRGAQTIDVNHSQLNCGDDCPECTRGILSQLKKRAPSLFLYAQAPIAALLLMLEVLRCSNCGREFRAPVPSKATQKYDPSAAAMLAVLRYLLGMPHTRIERLQNAFGIPLPTSTQWDVLRAYEPQLRSVFEQLVREAAQGDLMHCDDTVMRVLELLKEIRLEKANDPKARTGVFTTNIVSRAPNRQIVLFMTGRRHAGENIAHVLSFRDAGLEDILQMCDGLEHNSPQDVATILCNCLTHGRRQFVDLIVSFPSEVRRVLEDIKKVYEHEETTKKQGMTPEQRLDYHQEHSKPVLDALKLWFEKLQQDKLVEPNSGLGKAINYMLKRWEKLTRFLHVLGAPLDNNISERALKMAIVHRKNSLFYRSVVGAQLGDCIMSLGHTCQLNGVSPYDYLVALLTHIDVAATEPQLWMPWNYLQRQAELVGQSSQSVSQWAATLAARASNANDTAKPYDTQNSTNASTAANGITESPPVDSNGIVDHPTPERVGANQATSQERSPTTPRVGPTGSLAKHACKPHAHQPLRNLRPVETMPSDRSPTQPATATTGDTCKLTADSLRPRDTQSPLDVTSLKPLLDLHSQAARTSTSHAPSPPHSALQPHSVEQSWQGPAP